MRQLVVLGSLSALAPAVFADGVAPAATAAAPAPGFSFTSIGFLVVFIAIFYFLMIRPQSKRAKEHRNLLSQLSAGDEVVTTGGMLGRVAKVDDSFVELTIANNVDIRIQKQAIASVMPKGTIKAA